MSRVVKLAAQGTVYEMGVKVVRILSPPRWVTRWRCDLLSDFFNHFLSFWWTMQVIDIAGRGAASGWYILTVQASCLSAVINQLRHLCHHRHQPQPLGSFQQPSWNRHNTVRLSSSANKRPTYATLYFSSAEVLSYCYDTIRYAQKLTRWPA